MKYLICIGHPSQFHLFRNIIRELENRGHSTLVLSTNKDLLEDLFTSSGITFENILPRRKSGSLFHLTKNFADRFRIISSRIRQFRPDLLLGSEITLPLLGKTFSIPSIIFSEDDAKIIPQFARVAYPFASTILSPASCNAGRWEHKKIGYSGYQKLSYLHPARFVPHPVAADSSGRYFVLRFVKLTAYHDKERGGITTGIAQQLIDLLTPRGSVFISSERPLEIQFEKYRIRIDPCDIHSFLFYADLYIGDSQSMAVESAMLGTPSIRFSDFAGEISVLEELEHRYGLTKGLKTNQTDELFALVNEYLVHPGLKEEFAIRRKKMLEEKIDVAAFMVWFIENYPESKEIMIKNPDYQNNFK
jgi:uncharacterized protein